MATGAKSTEVGRIHIRVVPDADGFHANLRRQIAGSDDDLEVGIVPDLSRFRERVRAAAARLEAEVKVDADTANAARKISQLDDEVKRLKPRVEVDVDVKRGALARVLDMASRLKNVKGPSFGSGINPAGYAAIFAGIVALAGPVFGLLTTSLLSLPGLIAAVAAPIGALALGLDGLKSAASRLAQPFADLKATMSSFTEQQFSPVFDKLGAVFPTLQKALPRVTQGMADLARSFVDTITSGPGMAKVEGAINNIATALSKASPGISSFTDGLLTLAEKFTSKLPNVAEWFNGAGASFKNWIDKLSADGTLDKAFDGLGNTLKTLLEFLGGLGSEGMKFMEDPQKIQDFNNGLKSIGDNLQNIVTLSNQVGSGTENMLPSTNFGSGEIWDDLTKPFTSENAPWRGMWESLKSSNAENIQALKNDWADFTSSLGSVWESVKNGASTAWDWVKNATTTAWEGIKSAVVNGVSSVVQTVSELPGKIKAFFSDAGTWLVQAGKDIVQGLINGIGSMIDSAISKASELASSVKNAVTGFLGIHSPSRVMAELGDYTVQGFINGLNSRSDEMVDAARSIGSKVNDALSKSLDWESTLDSTLDMPFNFARANGNKLMTDLGFSGDGALSTIADSLMDWGINAGKKFIFQVNSVDEALSAQRNLVNREALQFTR
ncbi:cation transporter [Mycolicibacterium goodii]|uniref:phage tail protein n=1 Tax=Mycolicibacterium goodii TaxID=134601 RepID=UPI001BDD7AD3|nr:cation transporter [Mycolicibacterium goodii]MBU8808068.1 cation transporter [Mycolicibacterium goodii]